MTDDHIRTLQLLRGNWRSVGDAGVREALDAAIGALSDRDAVEQAKPEGWEFIGWEIQFMDGSWHRYRGIGEPWAYMTQPRRRIYAAHK
jgi:hypothetical protein